MNKILKICTYTYIYDLRFLSTFVNLNTSAIRLVLELRVENVKNENTSQEHVKMRNEKYRGVCEQRTANCDLLCEL